MPPFGGIMGLVRFDPTLAVGTVDAVVDDVANAEVAVVVVEDTVREDPAQLDGAADHRGPCPIGRMWPVDTGVQIAGASDASAAAFRGVASGAITPAAAVVRALRGPAGVDARVVAGSAAPASGGSGRLRRKSGSGEGAEAPSSNPGS